jgi:hypothetical protein
MADNGIELIAEEMIQQAAGIIRLNNAFKSGRLLNSFTSRIIEQPNGIIIQISNTASYAKFINEGTYQWNKRDVDHSQTPVIRKYQAVRTSLQGPFIKGIEPIWFMKAINFDLAKIKPLVESEYVKRTQKIIDDIFAVEFKKI